MLAWALQHHSAGRPSEGDLHSEDRCRGLRLLDSCLIGQHVAHTRALAAASALAAGLRAVLSFVAVLATAHAPAFELRNFAFPFSFRLSFSLLRIKAATRSALVERPPSLLVEVAAARASSNQTSASLFSSSVAPSPASPHSTTPVSLTSFCSSSTLAR